MRDISQSQINLFRHCPYAYALRYKFKKEAIMFDPSIVEVGSRVHDTIDKYYRTAYSPDFTQEQILAQSYNILRTDWDHMLPAEFLKKAYTCLEHFAEFEIKNINKGLLTKPLTEVKIKANGLYGIVDYLRLENQKVIDFKTNSRAGVGYANKMQAVMYKLLVKREFDIDIKYFNLFFLYPNEYRTLKFDGKYENIKKDLFKYVGEIREAWKKNQFPKKPRTKSGCNWCSFKYYCNR